MFSQGICQATYPRIKNLYLGPLLKPSLFMVLITAISKLQWVEEASFSVLNKGFGQLRRNTHAKPCRCQHMKFLIAINRGSNVTLSLNGSIRPDPKNRASRIVYCSIPFPAVRFFPKWTKS